LYTRQHGVEENRFLAPGEGDGVPEKTKVEITSAGGGEDAAALGLLTS